MVLWRAIHRWASTAGMLFIAYVAITGSIIAVIELTNPASFGAGGGQAALRTAEQRASDAPIPAEITGALAETALRGARAALPDATLTGARIRIYERDGQTLADVTLGTGYGADQVTVDAVTGARVRGAAEAQALTRFNGFLQELHSGAIAGLPGKFLVLLTGLALLVLCLTGGWIYIDMWRRRAGQGRKSPFWH